MKEKKEVFQEKRISCDNNDAVNRETSDWSSDLNTYYDHNRPTTDMTIDDYFNRLK
jgi:hypothetical protein